MDKEKLIQAYNNGIQEQEIACIQAIKETLDDTNTSQSDFMIELRDFLLAYNQ